MSTTYTVTRPGSATPVDLTVDEIGTGRPFLLLHGGAGPASFLPFASYLAEHRPGRALVPTSLGFNGTPRPDDIADVRALAGLYVDLLDELDLADVTVVGNSIGGWVAAEIALLASPRISNVVIMNGVGIAVPDHPVADFFSLTLDQLTELSYHDPSHPGPLGSKRPCRRPGLRTRLRRGHPHRDLPATSRHRPSAAARNPGPGPGRDLGLRHPINRGGVNAG
jgi:pimeloyl-ACP methyl ester carboxylesterase